MPRIILFRRLSTGCPGVPSPDLDLNGLRNVSLTARRPGIITLGCHYYHHYHARAPHRDTWHSSANASPTIVDSGEILIRDGPIAAIFPPFFQFLHENKLVHHVILIPVGAHDPAILQTTSTVGYVNSNLKYASGSIGAEPKRTKRRFSRQLPGPPSERASREPTPAGAGDARAPGNGPPAAPGMRPAAAAGSPIARSPSGPSFVPAGLSVPRLFSSAGDEILLKALTSSLTSAHLFNIIHTLGCGTSHFNIIILSVSTVSIPFKNTNRNRKKKGEEGEVSSRHGSTARPGVPGRIPRLAGSRNAPLTEGVVVARDLRTINPSNRQIIALSNYLRTKR